MHDDPDHGAGPGSRDGGDGSPGRPLPPPPTLGELAGIARQRFALRHPRFDPTRTVLVVAALVGVGGMVWALSSGGRSTGTAAPIVVARPSTTRAAADPSSTTMSIPEAVVVDVAGAVTHPGPVRVPRGARVDDAIAAAGGARPDADLERVSRAARVVDGQRIYVPRRGQTAIPELVDPGGATAATGAAPDPDGGASGDAPDAAIVNLNTADAAALDTLPGVGPATAAAIIGHRKNNGPFRSVDELLEVKGIGPAKLAELRPHVTV